MFMINKVLMASESPGEVTWNIRKRVVLASVILLIVNHLCLGFRSDRCWKDRF